MRIGSLFSGYGGAELAVQSIWPDAHPAWFVEYDKHPSAVLARHWPDVPNYGDVTAVDWEAVEPVDVLTGGYPCQPFSHAGQRRGTNDERHLFPYVAAAIGVLRPRLVLLENVAGHLTLGGPEVIGTLTGLGYSVRWGVVRASDAGAPHRRARLFIVATADTDDGRRGQRLRSQQPGHAVLSNGSRATADTQHDGRDVATVSGGLSAQQDQGRVLQPEGHAAGFGPYAAAVARWEHILRRPAPAPTEPGANGRPRLNPAFVEFIMGLPAGWVTDTDIPRSAQLKALGNGIVPQQMALALRLLLDMDAVAVPHSNPIFATVTAHPDNIRSQAFRSGALTPSEVFIGGDA